MESHVIYRRPEGNPPTTSEQEAAREAKREEQQEPETDELLVEAIKAVVGRLAEAGVTPEITRALHLVLHVAGHQVDTRDGRAHSDAVEAVQCLHGWLDGVAATATRGLHRAMAERFRPAVPEEELTKTEQRRWHRDVRKATQTELETTTGKGARSTSQLVDLATAPLQVREAIDEALADGGADSYRAWRVLDATDMLPDADRAAIARAVLPRRPDGTRRSLQSFTKALQRAVQKQLSAVPHLARKRDQRALEKRDSTSRVQDDGTGQVRTTGAVERIVAAHARIDGIARAAKRCGDEPRTLAQLRSDVALDLLQFGTIPPVVDEGDGTDTRPRPTLRHRDLGELPPAHVDVVVSLETLLGLSHGIGDLPGLSSISAARARQAAMTAGSVWRRLVIDPLDGHLVEKSSHSYRPSARVREQTTARDGICRFPGCQRPATRTQGDHVIAWTPDSEVPLTAKWNLESLCEFHHDAKTRALWVAIMNAAGEVRWTSPTGREYTTAPQDWAAATAAATDGTDGGYRWFRDQLDRLIRGEDNELDRDDLDAAIDHIASPDGRRVAQGSVIESQLASVLSDWWTNAKAALEGIEIWHRTEGGANRRGMAPRESTPSVSVVNLRHDLAVELNLEDEQDHQDGPFQREPNLQKEPAVEA